MIMQQITGFGGFFFRARNPELLSQWYEEKLGVKTAFNTGAWIQEEGPTIFAPFPVDTDYFGSKEHTYMLNFRVRNLDEFLRQLHEAGVRIDSNLVKENVGRFAWIYDPEGNKIELWEPVKE